MSDISKDDVMRFFKKPWFQRFAEKEGITDAALKSLVKEMEEGRINADLGGFVYKQRLAREGGGKSGAIVLCPSIARGTASFSPSASPSLIKRTSAGGIWSS